MGLFILARELRVDQKEMTIKQFITYLNEIALEKLIFYLLIGRYDWKQQKNLSPELVKEFIASDHLYQVIDQNFGDSIKVKWKIFRLLDNPVRVKNELINFLTNYYEKIHKQEVDRAEKIVTDYLAADLEEIKDYLAQGIKEFRDPTEYSGEIIGVMTYFSEISLLPYGKRSFLVGYRFINFLEAILTNELGIEEITGFLKVIADETRLRILLELDKQTKYAGELADQFEVSNANISYHISKFSDLGLIKTEHDQNKAYYKLRQEKIEMLIEKLQKLFLG
jgi:DNA-binding transcriptional ArsR family regulator